MGEKHFAALIARASALAVIMISFLPNPALASNTRSLSMGRAKAAFQFVQLPFMENRGQLTDKSVRFYTPIRGGTVFVTADGRLIYALARSGKGEDRESRWILRESLVGAANPQAKGLEETSTRVSVLRGKPASRPNSGISAFRQVTLGEIYPGIDLKIIKSGYSVEKLFGIKPKAAVERIRVRMAGAQGLKIDDRGELEVKTGLGAVRFTKPVAFQEDAGQRRNVEVEYAVEGDTYGFKVGAYDRSKDLFIDPLLASAFINEGGDHTVRAMALDGAGNVYATGSVSVTGPPNVTSGPETGAPEGARDVNVVYVRFLR